MLYKATKLNILSILLYRYVKLKENSLKEPDLKKVSLPNPKCYNCFEFSQYESLCSKPKSVSGSCFKTDQFNYSDWVN